MHSANLTKLAAGVTGVVEFKHHTSSYNFKIVADYYELRISLEDQTTKQRWQTAALEMDGFGKKDSVIASATLTDYATCFVSCLEAPLDSTDFSRAFMQFETEPTVWLLSLTLKLRLGTMTWTPTYTFQLLPVPLNVDVLAAKIQDQEGLIERLQGEVQEMKTKTDAHTAPVFVRAKVVDVVCASDRSSTSHTLVWKAEETTTSASSAIQLQEHGVIRLTTPGVFGVNVAVRDDSDSVGLDIQLNGTTVFSSYGCKTGRKVFGNYVFQAKSNDGITITYDGPKYACEEGSITIYQLR